MSPAGAPQMPEWRHLPTPGRDRVALSQASKQRLSRFFAATLIAAGRA
jgi:hypothetical protein